MSLTDMNIDDSALESDEMSAIIESLSEGKEFDLEKVLNENADENTDNTDVEIIDNVELSEDKEKQQTHGSGLMDLVRTAFDFLCANMKYIILGLVILLLLCNFKRDLFNNTPLEGHLENACNFMQTSLDGSLTSEVDPGMGGGSIDNLTSSLESMSATSGTSIQ